MVKLSDINFVSGNMWLRFLDNTCEEISLHLYPKNSCEEFLFVLSPGKPNLVFPLC